jgi:acyl-coenzyme A thioesterase PaaI-like protein
MNDLSEAAIWKAHCDAHPVEQETIDHFSATSSILKYLQNDKYSCVPTAARVLKPDGEDAFFAKTISTPETIPHLLTLLHRDFGLRKISSKDAEQNVENEPHTITLITFGGGDLVGFPGIVHGGVSTALLDEAMSFLLHMYHVRAAADQPRNSALTVNLNINLRGLVPGPGQVIIECRLMKVQGRKYFVKGCMKDTNGKILVDAEGLWISKRAIHL